MGACRLAFKPTFLIIIVVVYSELKDHHGFRAKALTNKMSFCLSNIERYLAQVIPRHFRLASAVVWAAPSVSRLETRIATAALKPRVYCNAGTARLRTHAIRPTVMLVSQWQVHAAAKPRG